MKIGDRVTTRRFPFFIGRVCGHYKNSRGRRGVTVEADAIPGLIHIYPCEVLDIVPDPDQIPLGL